MRNLLKETLEILETNNILEEDILWVGSESFGYFSWQDFKYLADICYDAGYGSSQVALDLVIVTKEGYLERQEHDGSEWWEYKTAPTKPKKYRKPIALTTEQAEDRGFNVYCGWNSLNEINGGG